MADERYEWLDADAAESLLRGEQVEPAGDHARTEAQRLAAALHEARSVPVAGGELRGEASALAAFRAASRTGRREHAGLRGGARSRSDAASGLADEPGTLRTVRMGAAPAAGSRGPRWSRPLRYGLVVSLAGCALGGVAVASGTGMLPSPFGGHGPPAPAASVSAAASPKELGSGPSPGTGPSVSPPASPGTSGSAAPSDPDDAAAPGTGTGGDGPSGHDDGQDTGSGAPDRDGDRNGSPDGTGGDGLPDPSGDARPGELYEKSVRACLDHRDDTLDSESRRRLIRLAKGERNLDRFCDRLLAKVGHDGEGAGDGSNGGEGAGSGEGGDKDAGEDSEASLPSVSFEMEPRASSKSDAEASRAGADDTVGTRSGPAASGAATLAPPLR